MPGLSGTGIFWALLSLLSSIASCVGFYTPFWLQGTMEDHSPVFFGTFRRCNYPLINDRGELVFIHECGRYTTFSDIPSLSWQIATLTVGIGCCLAFLVALTALMSICIRHIVTRTVAKILGILQLLAGLLVTSGVVLYPNGWDSSEIEQACGYMSRAYNLGTCTIGWAYFLTLGGAIVTLFTSAIACQAPPKKATTTTYNV